MEDEWMEESGPAAVAAPLVDLPEIKLFNKWSCDEVQVSDMSLQVQGISRIESIV